MTLDETNVADYAETLVLQVRGGGRELDYSEASVAVVEELLRVSDDLLQAENFPEAQRNLVVFYNGCYLGEVMARTLGGTWRFTPNWFDASLVFAYGEGGLQVSPFQKVHRRVTEGPTQDLVAYYQGLRDRLAEQDLP
uniref:DUF3806 domain-containing protein n=1 Tax=uncultured Armatimonadetes bacterium TaxID=157466 RepID=A0A6J4J8C2_9BACT|nr:hypothetical protein AVDCRST_MAG63-2916 [uncultured Armatimonadetes bacterium]